MPTLNPFLMRCTWAKPQIDTLKLRDFLKNNFPFSLSLPRESQKILNLNRHVIGIPIHYMRFGGWDQDRTHTARGRRRLEYKNNYRETRTRMLQTVYQYFSARTSVTSVLLVTLLRPHPRRISRSINVKWVHHISMYHFSVEYAANM